MAKELIITKCKQGFMVNFAEHTQEDGTYKAEDAYAFSVLEGRYGHETDCVLGFLREYFKDEDHAA